MLKFLPVFEQSKFTLGELKIQEGVFPYYNYNSEVHNFLEALYENNFIQPFNWSNWDEGKQLIDNSDLLDNASLQTLRKLLTTHVRADRFSEGHFAYMIETGHIVRILRRMAEIHRSSSCDKGSNLLIS